MITVTTTVFKKTTLALIGLACATGIVFSVGLSHQNDTEVQAATVETSRLWAKIVNKDQWDSSGASTYIHYWGGDSATSWFGVPIKWDSANDLVYYDVPSNTTGVIFVRVSADKTTVWNQTADLVATGHFNNWYFNLTGYGSGEWKNDLTFSTTTIVSNFAATIDTDTEACSESSAQAAVNAYNALSTFEQDQFDVLSVGGGFTGLQRLNFLKTFYSISTPLNINNIGDGNNSDDSLMTMLIIGAIGLTTLGGYYIISRKKHLA